jgi:hypothetical protein
MRMHASNPHHFNFLGEYYKECLLHGSVLVLTWSALLTNCQFDMHLAPQHYDASVQPVTSITHSTIATACGLTVRLARSLVACYIFGQL